MFAYVSKKTIEYVLLCSLWKRAAKENSKYSSGEVKKTNGDLFRSLVGVDWVVFALKKVVCSNDATTYTIPSAPIARAGNKNKCNTHTGAMVPGACVPQRADRRGKGQRQV